MDEIFGVIDDRFKVSIVDSTMMWIVHHAMDKAHERVKSREGVIERLHEISKFYELAVMQLDGCLKFVQEESDNHNLESCHEEQLAGLTEFRNRLQQRLHESELAILQKDREFMERFESELKLRQALEIKEIELVSSQENLEIAKTKSVENSILRHRKDGNDDSGNDDNDQDDDGDGDGEFCEFDRQVLKIGERLEFDYVPEEKKRNQCIDDEKVEEMESDIDILKETIDIAFGKMHNAIFFSEMGPMEQQIKSSIENGIMSIFLKGFMRDFQEDLAAKSRGQQKQISNVLNENWSDLMNEVTSLCEDLKPLICQNEVRPKNVQEKTEEKNFQVDNTSAKYRINNNEKESEHDGSHSVAKMIKNHESIIRKKSAEAEEVNRLRQEMLREKIHVSSKRGEDPVSLKSRIQEVLEKMENLITLNAKVNKVLGEKGESNEDDDSLEKNEEVLKENERRNSDVDTLVDVRDKIHRLQDEENIEIQNEICMLRQEREDKEFQNVMMEEIYLTLFKGLMENFCNDFCSWELENLISDNICRDFIRNTFNQQNETTENNKIEAQIKDDIFHVIFKEAMKDDCSTYDFGLAKSQNVNDGNLYREGSLSDINLSQSLESKIRQEIYGIPFIAMLKEWQKVIGECTTETLLREEISWFVSVETIKSIVCKADHYPDAEFFNDSLQDSPITIQEDICLVFLREMVKEWEEKIEAHDMEILIGEEICYTILEAEKEVYNRYTEVDTPIQESVIREEHSIKSQCEDPDKGIEVEENLMLSANSEIMEYNSCLNPVAPDGELDESKTSFVESKDMKCTLISSSSLEIIVPEPEKACQSFPIEVHNLQLNQSDSECTKLLEFSHIFDDFKLMANKKLGAMVLRLEEMKHILDPLAQIMASLQEKKTLYKKAFISRCQNLRKAENEVDLLGDQVDILLSLLEKIYLILNHHSPVFQQYFDVSGILGLIKEVAGMNHQKNEIQVLVTK